MPMNKFLFDHQLAAMKIDRSGSAEERAGAIAAMDGRARRIAHWRKANGLSNVGWPRDERAAIDKDQECDHPSKRSDP